ncbi:hypothetical protein [Actinoplanes sp. NBRC 103695]|uniref:hypothetical protein n=1 Tax=Actinoplanes sp. NBRC 103695 TaxID=3032202 RepID=UPI002553561B|nr:hypothetical protein [Actinoplanes sp. NBRC 103695]
MDRDTGLSRTTTITGALVVASLSGTLAIGLVARDAESPGTTTSTPTDDASSSTGGATTGSDTDGESESSGSTSNSPTLSPGDDGSGQATSGGS